MGHMLYAPQTGGRTRSVARGYTLVEVLLVVMILGIMTTVALVSFSGLAESQRLNTATRKVVSAGRYARAAAVIGQREMAVTFDASQGRVTVSAIPPKLGVDDTVNDDMFSLPDPGGAAAAPEAEPETPVPSGDGDLLAEEMTITLDGVKIASVKVDGGEEATGGGAVSVVYASHGRCPPHTVILEDSDNRRIRVEVDAVGSAQIE